MAELALFYEKYLQVSNVGRPLTYFLDFYIKREQKTIQLDHQNSVKYIYYNYH
jgi:hypothetical protein